MRDYREGLWRIPEHMHDSIYRWIETADLEPRLLGSFLRAVLSNDLVGAYAAADDQNTAMMHGWVMFLYNDAPAACYGSPAALQAWHDRGGLRGRHASDPMGDTQ